MMNDKERIYYYKCLFILAILGLLIWFLQPLSQAFADYSFVTKWPSQSWDIGRLKGIAVDTLGNIYVADTHKHRIQKLSPQGIFLTKWGSFGSLDGMFYWPEGLAVDSSGNVFVADTDNDRVQKFNSKGEYLDQWGSSGSSDGKFNKPRGIAVDSISNVFVTDSSNRRIQKFSSKGDFQTKWGSAGSSNSQFQFPEGLDVDSSGNVYVADRGNDRIQKFNSKGEYLDQWGSSGTGDGEFNEPVDVAVDSAGNVYVSEYMNKRIQKFSEAGNTETQTGNVQTSGVEGSLENEATNNSELIEKYNSVDMVASLIDNKSSSESMSDLKSVSLSPKMYLPNVTKNYCGWTTTLNIQNIGTDEAIVQAHFISKSGDTVQIKTYEGLKPLTSYKINPLDEKIIAQGFQGSVVVYADQPLASVVNEHASFASMAYEGVDSVKVGKKVFLPNITRDYADWVTTFAVQNVGIEEATVNIDFYSQGDSSPIYSETIPSLSPGASVGVNPNNNYSLGTFRGSVVIKSNQNIAAIVNEHMGEKKSMSYTGFNSGTKNVFLPDVCYDPNFQNTPIVIQNLGDGTTDINAEFYRQEEDFIFLNEKFASVNSGFSVSMNPFNYFKDKFVGKVKVTSSSATVAAIYNKHYSSDAVACSGFGRGAIENYLPNIVKNYSGWTSTIVVQNVDNEKADITIHLYDENGGEIETISKQALLKNDFYQFNLKEYEDLGESFNGSAVVESLNHKKIITIVNNENDNGQKMSYSGSLKD